MAADQALALFCRRPPHEADRLIITAHTFKGQHVVQDVSAREVTESAVQFANAIVAHAKQWALAEGHVTRFLATWCTGARVLGSYQWSCGDGRPPMDGTAVSQIVQSQSHSEVLHRLYAESFANLAAGWERDAARKDRRIEALEKECDSLRDRLRRADDLDATLATQQVEADLEQRARTQAILEERVLPLVEGFAVRFLQSQMNGSAPPSAAAGEHEQSEAAAEDE